MNWVRAAILLMLILLAMSSGITKVLLMQQEVDFFGRYGFSNPILVAFGATQFIGAVLMAFRKIRFFGAVIVATTFLISLVVLLMDGNVPVSIATIVATLLLGWVIMQSRSVTSNKA